MNKARGEVAIEINGEMYTLLLTLGALAEIEDVLGVTDFAGLTDRLAKPGAQDLIRIMCVLLKAGGNEMAAADLAQATLSLKELVQAISRAFGAALAEPAGEAESHGEGKPPSL